ncbi:MAG: energy transducer TonB, partial [Crocinitomicaceae bacterium]
TEEAYEEDQELIDRMERMEEVPAPVIYEQEDINDRPVQEEIIDFPDVEASYPGGTAALQQFINENVQYPVEAIEKGIQGKVYLSFVVEPDGNLTNIKVERGVSMELDREAKRVVRSMPKWIPGEAGGKKIRTKARLPITFQLSDK